MSDYADKLFPIPTFLPHRIVPRPLPGSTPESFAVLQECLKDNHEKHHAFFDKSGFHNHITHHLVALWHFGAPASLIKNAYAVESEFQRPRDLGLAPSELEVITDENFIKHLGDERYFSLYVKYFTYVVEEVGPIAALEKYVFAEKYNVLDPSIPDTKQPMMLGRYVSAILHSMIQFGNGLEFGLPGLAIEGLAETAVHRSETPAVIRSVFPAYKTISAQPIHAFTVLSRILADPSMKVQLRKEGFMYYMYSDAEKEHGPRILAYLDEWLAYIDVEDAHVMDKLERKTEELIWVCALMYGVGGWSRGKEFNADFFTMHFVTSSLFLTSHHAALKPAAQIVLLRTFFAVCILWYIIRGRPQLDIEGFFAATSSSVSDTESTSNPWIPIVEASLTHPDEHLIKLQRALAHFSVIYGIRNFGYLKESTRLGGVEYLDGTLFIRIAQLSQVRMEKDREAMGRGVQGLQWDRSGFFDAE